MRDSANGKAGKLTGGGLGTAIRASERRDERGTNWQVLGTPPKSPNTVRVFASVFSMGVPVKPMTVVSALDHAHAKVARLASRNPNTSICETLVKLLSYRVHEQNVWRKHAEKAIGVL